MRRALPIVTISAILLALVAAAPAAALAGGFRGPQGFNPRGGFQGFNPGGGFQGFNPGHTGRSFKPLRLPKDGRFFPHRGFDRFWGGGGYVAGGYGATVYYGPPSDPPVVYDTPVYAPAPTYAPPPVYLQVVVPVASSPAPAAPERPGVVEYPEGRYELRGDGVTAPYNWVWIPNPPAAPPASGPLPTAPAPSSDDRSPRRRSELYRWDDEQGVVHLTDNAAIVPERFRKKPTSNDAR